MFKFIAKYIVPLLSLGLLILAIGYIAYGQSSSAGGTKLQSPPSSAFDNTVAATGIVEAATENILLGSERSGVCSTVLVEEGEQVTAGQPVIQLSTTAARAVLNVQQGELKVAEARLALLKQQPRQETIPPLQAAISTAQARLRNSRDNYQRLRELRNTNSIPERELIQAKATLDEAEAFLKQTETELDLVLAGSWKYEIDQAQAEVDLAKARTQQAEAELQLLTIRSPIDAQVLQVSVRPGQFVIAGPNANLMVLGKTSQLNIRVDIDESDIPRFRTDQSAYAVPRGAADVKIPLSFLRLEPYVIPKTNLSGSMTERVDVRVLQAIYRVEDANARLFVGQQVDVFLESNATRNSAATTDR